MFKIGDDKLHYEKFSDGSVVCIEDEIPFDIPESWAWCHLSDIVAILNGDRGQNYPSKDKLQKAGIPFVSAINIERFAVNDKKLLYLSGKQYSLLRAGKLEKNDILYCIRGSLGKCGIFQMEQGAIASSLVIVRPYFKTLSTIKYLLSYLTSDFIKTEIHKYDNGTAQPNLAASDFSQFLFPLPPLSEQKRISETVETLLELVDSIESAKIDLSDLIKQTKAKVLDLAIKGKLVPQDTNDESADKLLEKIREEKEKLIKEGKLKRDKNETYIFKNSDDNSYYEQIDGETVCIDDDLPFEIPQSWRWCKVDNVTTIKGGKRLPSGQSLLNDKTNHPYLRIVDMKNNTIIDDDIHYISEDVFAKIKQYIITDEDLYITIAGTIGNVGIIPSKYNNANLTENAVRVTPLLINKKYLMYLILSNYVQNQFIDKTHHVAMPKLAIERIKGVFVPIPPLFEQSNIINKLESIFSYLDNLESIIKGS